MSLDAWGALDDAPDLNEFNSGVEPEPSVVIPEEEPYDKKLELISTGEGLAALVEEESEMAESVVNTAQDSLEAASAATDPTLFAEESLELERLADELSTMPPVEPYTANEKESALRFGQTEFEEDTTTESGETLGTYVLKGSEITELTPSESENLARADAIANYSGEKAASFEEISALIANIDSLMEREFTDDRQYEEALAIIKQDLEFTAATVPEPLDEGAEDMETGETLVVDMMPLESDLAAMAQPSGEELANAYEEINRTTRGKLEGLKRYLEDYREVATNINSPIVRAMPDTYRAELLRKANSLKFSLTERAPYQEPLSEPEAGIAEYSSEAAAEETNDAIESEPAVMEESAEIEEVAEVLNTLDTGGDIDLERFFSIGQEQLSTALSSVDSLPLGNPVKNRALKMIEIRQMGKAAFQQANPGATTISFN